MALESRNEAGDRGQVLSSRLDLSRFELFLTCNPPILESFLLQAPTSTILALYHTSSYLRQFIRTYPTSWRYLSFRLHQPQPSTAATNQINSTGVRQSSNYALDQLLIYIVNPFSTCLTSLELDNTAVSGQILTQTVLHLRRDTLTHLSVRGCKNVSLKYHINPWLTLYALTSDLANPSYAPKEFQQLALKSLYVYRCRHHRRRPYLPQSLVRKDSDSEPTHELVNICNKLSIWTDTAWCTTPGARCDRRKGYVSQRVPPDPREVWVVYDRLWRSKNWLGPVEGPGIQTQGDPRPRKRKRDGRSWEYGEDAAFGEALGTRQEGKALPAHLRQSHREFVENITCDNCSSVILERCEQCSVRMHCSGCRKTLCASCAFDRPYLRNKNASDEAKNSIWWAPGCAVSPCSMQDSDVVPVGPGINPPPTTNVANSTPNLKLKWCCTEPSFSGGGGITFFGGLHPDNEQVKAAPLPRHRGWEDLEFDRDMEIKPADAQIQPASSSADPSEDVKFASSTLGLAGRFASIDELFYACPVLHGHSSQALRNLCDECYSLETWKVTCKACSLTICLKHDVREKLRVRICGYRDLATEKMDFRTRQKLSKSRALATKNDKHPAAPKPLLAPVIARSSAPDPGTPVRQTSQMTASGSLSVDMTPSSTRTVRTLMLEDLTPIRSTSPGSNSTGPPSRASSPSPSDDTSSTTSEDRNLSRRTRDPPKAPPPDWRGCQGFLCPPTRPPGDNRRRCLAVTRQCGQCSVHVCDTCLVDIGSPCPCKGCQTPTATSTGTTTSVGEPRFFCPNCRYDRMASGECKRRLQVGALAHTKKKGSGKVRARKPVAERVTQLHPGQNFNGLNFSNITDEAIEQVGEFMQRVYLSDTELAEPATAPENAGGRQPRNLSRLATAQEGEEDEEDIREVADMAAMVRDLVRRVQRLRGRMRPGSAARNALPDLRMDGENEATGAEPAAEVAIEANAPVVEGMD